MRYLTGAIRFKPLGLRAWSGARTDWKMSELLDIKAVALLGFPSNWRFRNVDMSSHHSSIDDGWLARFGVAEAAEPGSKCNESEANERTRTRQNMSWNRGNLIVRVQNSVFIYMIWWYYKSNGKLKAKAT
jgi:hypothetical protein